MKRFPALVIVASCLWPLPASAQDNKSITTIGAGRQSCGAWTRARQSKSSSMFENWLLGYASGINTLLFFDQHVDVIKGTDADALFAWVDNYCRTKPLEKVIDAAGELMGELRARALKQQPAAGNKNQ